MVYNVHVIFPGADTSSYIINKEVKGLYFSTPAMKEYFAAYNEVIFFDGTYNLFENKFTLMIWSVEDKFGNTRIVNAGVVADETEDTVKWLWKEFKKSHFEACKTISRIMTDKDLTARPVIHNVIPHAQLLICEYHTLKTFGNEIYKKRGVTESERQKVLIILDRMTKSNSETEYLNYYKKLTSVASASVIKYSNKNWHI